LRIMSKCSIFIAVSNELSHVPVAQIASLELGEVRFLTRTRMSLQVVSSIIQSKKVLTVDEIFACKNFVGFNEIPHTDELVSDYYRLSLQGHFLQLLQLPYRVCYSTQYSNPSGIFGQHALPYTCQD